VESARAVAEGGFWRACWRPMKPKPAMSALRAAQGRAMPPSRLWWAMGRCPHRGLAPLTPRAVGAVDPWAARAAQFHRRRRQLRERVIQRCNESTRNGRIYDRCSRRRCFYRRPTLRRAPTRRRAKGHRWSPRAQSAEQGRRRATRHVEDEKVDIARRLRFALALGLVLVLVCMLEGRHSRTPDVC
jgi:hypothetical protein